MQLQINLSWYYGIQNSNDDNSNNYDIQNIKLSTYNNNFHYKSRIFTKLHDLCSWLQILDYLKHQANKLSRSSSVQNMNSLHEISSLTAGYWVSVVATRVMIKHEN